MHFLSRIPNVFGHNKYSRLTGQTHCYRSSTATTSTDGISDQFVWVNAKKIPVTPFDGAAHAGDRQYIDAYTPARVNVVSNRKEERGMSLSELGD